MLINDTPTPTPTLDGSGMEVLTYEDCRALLSIAKVGRLGFVDSGGPVILPVNFAMDGSRVVFRTGHGSKHAAAIMHAPVCLEIDHWDESSRTGWSILAKGFAEPVTGPDTVRFERLGVAPAADETTRTSWVRIITDEITGRRIPNAQPSDAIERRPSG